MTYAEKELHPLGFRTVDAKERNGFTSEITLSFGHLKLQFGCCCPAYPRVKALGCPLHHVGPGGSWPVEDAKKIAVDHPKNVRVEIESEIAPLKEPARVLVYEDNKLVTEVIAKIKGEQGADGGIYSCVKLEKVTKT